MLELGEKHGFRNAQVTVIAPTGTIGLVMDCDTTGIEPDFALVKFKKLAGGGYFKIINASVPPALARLGYTPRQIDDIVRYCRGAGTLARLPAHQPRRRLKAKGFTDEVLAEGRGAAARRVRAAVRLQPLDARRRLPQGHARHPGRAARRARRSTCSRTSASPGSRSTEASAYVCGTMTIEGAPHLKAEHYPVFDCANKCGKTRQALPVGRVAHPHDGRRPAVHLAGRSRRRSTCRTTPPSRT